MGYDKLARRIADDSKKLVNTAGMAEYFDR